MTGPSERKLEKVLSADPGQVRGAGRAWQVAAEGLQQVADALDSAQGDLAEAWQGRDATAATAAFSTLGSSVRANEGRMQTAAEALDGAAEALAAAQRAHASLPAVPPEPTFPDGGDDGQVSSEQEIHYIKLLGVQRSAANNREAQAEAAYQTLVAAMGDSSDQLGAAAPESTQRTWGNTPAATTPTGAAPGSVTTSTGLPVLGGGGGSVSGTGIGGTGGTAHAVGAGATGFVGSVSHPTDVTSATPSGVVGTTTTAPLGQGHVAPAPVEVVGEGATGGPGSSRGPGGRRRRPRGRPSRSGWAAVPGDRPRRRRRHHRRRRSPPGHVGRDGAHPAGGHRARHGFLGPRRSRQDRCDVHDERRRPTARHAAPVPPGVPRRARGAPPRRSGAGPRARPAEPVAAAARVRRRVVVTRLPSRRAAVPPSRPPRAAAPRVRSPVAVAQERRAGATGRGGAAGAVGAAQDERATRRRAMLIDDEDAWLDDDDSNPGVIR